MKCLCILLRSFFSLSLLYYWWCCWCYYVCYHIRWLVRSVALESHKEKQGKELVTSFLIYTWQQQHQQKTNRKRLHKITLLHKCKPMEETKRLGKQMPIKSLSSNRGNNNNDNKKPSHLFCVDSLTNNEESIAMDQQNDSMIILSRNKKKCATIYDFHHGLRYIYIYLMCVFSRLCVLFFSLFFMLQHETTKHIQHQTEHRTEWNEEKKIEKEEEELYLTKLIEYSALFWVGRMYGKQKSESGYNAIAS